MVLRWRGAKNICIYCVFLFREREKSRKHRLFDAFWGFAKTVGLTLLGGLQKVPTTKRTTTTTTGPSSNSNNNNNNNNNNDDADAANDDEDDDNNDNTDNDDNDDNKDNDNDPLSFPPPTPTGIAGRSSTIDRYNEGTWRGRLFSYSYAVPFPGIGSEHHVKPRRPRLGKFRDTTFSSKITLAPFPPVLLPHPPGVRAVAGVRRRRPQAWTGRLQSPHSWIGRPKQPRSGRACHSERPTGKDWASITSARWQGARLILFVSRRARQSSARRIGLIRSSLSPCYVFGPRRQLHMRPGSGNGPLNEAYFNLLDSRACTVIVSLIARPHWRQHMYQRILPCCLYGARCSRSCVCFATPKRGPGSGPRNGAATQDLQARPPNSWPHFGPMAWAPACP